MAPQLPPEAPTPEQVRQAWRQAFAEPAADGDRQRDLGVLLDGLPMIASGRVQDGGRELTVGDVVEKAAAHAPAVGWRARERPFLAELARRALALGLPRGPNADEDPLVHPHRALIDPQAADAALAFARATVAVELQSSGLLAVVVARHLAWRAREGEAGRRQPALPWLAPLLEDCLAQCLLVSALAGEKAGPEAAEVTWLLRQLMLLYAECHRENTAWPAGPLAACCALGVLLHRPREAGLVKDFKERVKGWNGWGDEDAWPTRLPGAGLDDVKARLTEHIAAAVGAANRRVWMRRALEQALEGCWPPLLSFCLSAPEAQKKA
jgi:hypothetical protein